MWPCFPILQNMDSITYFAGLWQGLEINVRQVLSPIFGMSSIRVDNKIITIIIIAFVVIRYDL